jgi:hypothetical protein
MSAIKDMPHNAIDVVKAIDQIQTSKDVILYLDSARRHRNHLCHEYPATPKIWATQAATEGMRAVTTVGHEIQKLRAGVYRKVYIDLEDAVKVC